MKKESDIARLLENDINETIYKINNRKEYNNKRLFKYILIKGALIIEKIIPYMVSGVITFCGFNLFDRTPFFKNDIKEIPSVKKTTFSTGYEEENISYDIKYKDASLSYSTAWIINKYGYYERTIKEYELIEDISNYDINSILNLTEEELQNMFSISNIKVIEKNELSKEDEVYNKAVIVINQIVKEHNYYNIRRETDIENLIETMLFILLAYIIGNAVDGIFNIVIKENLSLKLRKIEYNYAPIADYEIDNLNKVLDLKKENIKLIK